METSPAHKQVRPLNHPAHRLEIHAETDDLGRQILTLSGDVDRQTVGQLREHLLGGAAGATTMVIDLREVEFMDSPGLGALVHCQRVLAHKGTRLVTRAAQGDVRDLLETTGADELLTIEDPPAVG